MTQKHKGNERKNVSLQAITIKLTTKIMKLKQTMTLALAALSLTTAAQERRRGFQRPIVWTADGWPELPPRTL